MYSNNIVNFQESTTFLMPVLKKVRKHIEWINVSMYIYIYIYRWGPKNRTHELFYYFCKKKSQIYIIIIISFASTDIPDPLSLLLPIVHRLWQVFRATSVSSESCCMYVRAGRPAFAWPYVGVHWSTSLMSSSLLLQQCPACLVRLTVIVFVMGGRWPYI